MDSGRAYVSIAILHANSLRAGSFFSEEAGEAAGMQNDSNGASSAAQEKASAGGEGTDALLPVVYDELRALAEGILHRWRPAQTARTTSLIQDAYLRLAHRSLPFRDRSHFLCVAAKAMRSVLIDYARRNGAAKRGGRPPGTLPDESIVPAEDGPDLLAVHEALLRLAEFDERKSRIVELRFFGGLSVEESAEALAVSPATIKREWSLAKAWLYREIAP